MFGVVMRDTMANETLEDSSGVCDIATLLDAASESITRLFSVTTPPCKREAIASMLLLLRSFAIARDQSAEWALVARRSSLVNAFMSDGAGEVDAAAGGGGGGGGGGDAGGDTGNARSRGDGARRSVRSRGGGIRRRRSVVAVDCASDRFHAGLHSIPHGVQSLVADDDNANSPRPRRRPRRYSNGAEIDDAPSVAAVSEMAVADFATTASAVGSEIADEPPWWTVEALADASHATIVERLLQCGVGDAPSIGDAPVDIFHADFVSAEAVLAYSDNLAARHPVESAALWHDRGLAITAAAYVLSSLAATTTATTTATATLTKMTRFAAAASADRSRRLAALLPPSRSPSSLSLIMGSNDAHLLALQWYALGLAYGHTVLSMRPPRVLGAAPVSVAAFRRSVTAIGRALDSLDAPSLLRLNARRTSTFATEWAEVRAVVFGEDASSLQ
jgi:hypothetical protein